MKVTTEMLARLFQKADFGCGCCSSGKGRENASRFRYLMNCQRDKTEPTDAGWKSWTGDDSDLFDF